MKKLKTTAVKFLAIALLVMVPVGLFYVLVGPEFEISITQIWGRVIRDTTEIRTIIAFNNPTLLARWLKKIELEIYINDLKITSEVNETNIEVKPLAETKIQLTSFLDNARIPDLWATYLNGDNLFRVEVDGNVTFRSTTRETVCPIGYKTSAHTDLLDLLRVTEPREIRAGTAALTLETLVLDWSKATAAQTEMNTEALIYNPNSYPVTVTAINYTVEMNSIKMGGDTIYVSKVLEPQRNTTVSFTATLNNTMLHPWWVTHLGNDQITTISLKVQAEAEVLGIEYSSSIIETAGSASIRILGSTMTYGYYLPLL